MGYVGFAFSACLAVAFQTAALAQTKSTVYACTNEAAAGLNWNSSRWVTASFKPAGKFLMTVHREPDKVLLEVKGDNLNLNCRVDSNLDDNPFAQGIDGMVGLRNCVNIVGEAVRFSEKEERGVISYLHGGTDSGAQRDSLVIMPFVCQKF